MNGFFGPRLKATALLVAALLLSACGAGSADFAKFANAGATFSDSAPGAYDYAYEQFVRTQLTDIAVNNRKASEAAAAGRPKPVVDQLQRDLAETAKNTFDNTMAYRKQLAGAKEHATALRDYFVALRALASDIEPEAAGASAAGFAQKLGQLTGASATFSVVGSQFSAASLLQPFVRLAVAEYRNERLRRHLETYQQPVGDAIALQEAMFAAMRRFEVARGYEWVAIRTRQDLAAQYADLSKPLPPDWLEKSMKVLSTEPGPSPISQALDAAHLLRTAFENLLQGKAGALGNLEQAAAYINVLIGAFEAARRENTP